MLAQALYLINARHRRIELERANADRQQVVWFVLGVLLGLQLLFVYLPFMNAWFSSAPLGLAGWLICLGLALVVFSNLEAREAVFRAYQRNVNPPRNSSSVGSIRGP